MKKIILLPLFVVFSLLFSSYISEENKKIYGVWWSPEKESKIKIYKNSAGKVVGKIVWLKDGKNADGTNKKDINNPNEKLRGQTILNLIILNDFEYDEDDEWDEGTIYDPKSGKVYSGKKNKLDTDIVIERLGKALRLTLAH